MSKVKSAICLTLMTLLVAALCFICLVSFNYGPNKMHRFDSIVAQTQKDPDLGGLYGAGEDEQSGKTYLGGGYSAVYYPEGVLSAKAYNDNLAVMPEETDKQKEDKQKYVDKYVGYPKSAPVLYLEKEVVCEDDSDEPSEEFIASVKSAQQLLQARYEKLNGETRVDIVDDFTVRVFVPASLSSAISAFSATGEFSVLYGTSSSSSSADKILPERNKSINDYVKNCTVRVAANGVPYVLIKLTAAGKKIVSDKTANAADSTGYLFFRVGETDVLSLSVESQIKSSSITLASASFTKADATIRATVIDTALSYGEETALELTVSDITAYHALYGDKALPLMYIALAVCFVAMMIFFFIRYRAVAFVNMYTYLLFLCVSILCVWAIPFLNISVETVLAFLITSVVLCASNAVVIESARKEYALGKTMTSSVKGSYKKHLWHLIDLHVVLAVVGFIIYFIALGPIRTFAFTLALTSLFSGVFSLLVNRFNWCIMMSLSKNKAGFTGFKREEVEDE